MHIETLKVFSDLVELESFSLAAERNFITQSAVSQQIRALEDKFKRRLLERVISIWRRDPSRIRSAMVEILLGGSFQPS